MLAHIKRQIQQLTKIIPLPLWFKCLLARNDIRFLDYLFFPSIDFIINYYNSDLKMRVNPLYPIEREMITGSYDPHSISVINKFLKIGGCGVDVGANVGALTLIMAKQVNTTGKVIAFEPGPPIFQRLKFNIELNPATNEIISCKCIGISNKNGKLYWNEDMNNRGNGSLLGNSGVPVAVVTLDDILRHESRLIDFIKIDVEGMELEVIQGAIKILKKYKPVIYFETLKPFIEIRGLDVFTEIKNLLYQLQFVLFDYSKDRGLRRVDLLDLPTNTLAIHKHKIKNYI